MCRLSREHHNPSLPDIVLNFLTVQYYVCGDFLKVFTGFLDYPSQASVGLTQTKGEGQREKDLLKNKKSLETGHKY